MPGELMRLSAFIVAIVTVGAGSGWALGALFGPPPPAPDESLFPDDPEVLVLYPTRHVIIQTDFVRFDNTGKASFTPVALPYRNISRVVIGLEVTMDGAAVGDSIDLRVMTPDAQRREGGVAGPNSGSGYQVSQQVIEWARKAAPQSRTYQTHDPEQALAWSAENHTDERSTGQWAAFVHITPSGSAVAPRNGQARLTFDLTIYEALAFPQWAPENATYASDVAGPVASNESNNASQGDGGGTRLTPLERAVDLIERFVPLAMRAVA